MPLTIHRCHNMECCASAAEGRFKAMRQFREILSVRGRKSSGLGKMRVNSGDVGSVVGDRWQSDANLCVGPFHRGQVFSNHGSVGVGIHRQERPRRTDPPDGKGNTGLCALKNKVWCVIYRCKDVS